MFFKILFINLLTLIRVIGAFILVPIYHNYGGFYVGILASICYFTDSIDGMLARRWNASTFFGALFDSFADKLFTIVSYIVLYLITPYALIPIIFEILTVIVQLIKYKENLNIQSNVIGKFKVWVLAISVVLTFLISDLNTFNGILFNLLNGLKNISLDKIYFWLLIPAIIMEGLTFLSYFLEMFTPNNMEILASNQKEGEDKNKVSNKSANFKEVWLDPAYYNKHKDDDNIRKVTKISKKK